MARCGVLTLAGWQLEWIWLATIQTNTNYSSGRLGSSSSSSVLPLTLLLALCARGTRGAGPALATLHVLGKRPEPASLGTEP